MALLPAGFPGLPPNALDRMNGERRVWCDAIDAALSQGSEEERWLALGRVMQEARELVGVAMERLVEEEGLAEDERSLGTIVCADGARVFLVNGLALHVLAAPAEGASAVAGDAVAAAWRAQRDEQRVLDAAWAALVRAGTAPATRLALPLTLLARFRGLCVAACAVWPVPVDPPPSSAAAAGPPPDVLVRAATAPLADAPPYVRSLAANAAALRLQPPHAFLTAPLREQLARDALWPALPTLPALLWPADPAQPVAVEQLPRAGWAEALEALLGARHEAWHLPSSPHSLFFQAPAAAAAAALNARATEHYVGSNFRGVAPELRGTVVFVPRFREAACLVRPELALLAATPAPEVAAQLEVRVGAVAERFNVDAPVWPWQLVEVMHSVGLPARYLGLVRQRVREPRVRRLLLVEGAVRALKTRLGQCQAQRAVRAGNDVLLAFLNALLGDGPAADALWRTHVPHLMACKYPQLLDAREGAELRALLAHHRLALLRGLQRATGVRLKDAVEARLVEAAGLRLAPGTVLALADIAAVAPVVRGPTLPRAELLAQRLALPTEAPKAGAVRVEARKASTMDPRVLAERAEDEAAGWVFVDRASTASRKPAAARAKPPPAAEAKGAEGDGNCTVM